MPITKSAKKALRQSKRKAEVNKSIRTSVKRIVAKVRKSPNLENLKKAYSILDRAAKKKVIKKGKADRLKSRLTKLFNQKSTSKKKSKKSGKKSKKKTGKKS